MSKIWNGWINKKTEKKSKTFFRKKFESNLELILKTRLLNNVDESRYNHSYKHISDHCCTWQCLGCHYIVHVKNNVHRLIHCLKSIKYWIVTRSGYSSKVFCIWIKPPRSLVHGKTLSKMIFLDKFRQCNVQRGFH